MFSLLKSLFHSLRSATPRKAPAPTDDPAPAPGERSVADGKHGGIEPAPLLPQAEGARQAIPSPSTSTDTSQPSLVEGKPLFPPADCPSKPKPAKPKPAALPRRKPRHPADPARTRNGIPVLRSDADIIAAFTAPERPEPSGSPEVPKPPADARDPEKPALSPTRPGRRVRRPPVPVRNRHGIPLFHDAEDFTGFFRDPREADSSSGRTLRPPASPGKRPTGAFARMLEETLAGKTREILMAEKREGLPADGPPTLAQRLKTYPPPQDELDLHGHTGPEAAERTEAFIRQAHRSGKRTVLIIVGRGTHSEGRPVLPDVVETRLADLRRKGLLLAFEWERLGRRRGGAIVAYLDVAA